MRHTDSATPMRYATVTEAARILSVSTRTIWQWIAEKRLPSVKLARRTTRIPIAGIEAFIAEAERGDRPPAN